MFSKKGNNMILHKYYIYNAIRLLSLKDPIVNTYRSNNNQN